MTHSCRSGHRHDDPVAVLLCQQDQMIDLLEGLTLMSETTGETIDQGFADLDAGQDDIEAKLDALSAEETKELAFLADLENNRGAGQLAPEQQATLDALKARQASVAAALDAAREELAQADGTDPAPPVTQPVPPVDGTPVEPAPEPVPSDGEVTGDGSGAALPPISGTDAPVGEPVSDTPIADGIPVPAADDATDGTMTGGPVDSVHDEPGDEPASNEV